MPMQEFMHAPVKAIDFAVEAGVLPLYEARQILTVRAGRQSVPGRHARAWLAAHPLPGGRTTTAPAVPTVPQLIVVGRTTPTRTTAPAKGVGAKGGDVRWGIASRLTKGQGYDARRAEHERLLQMTPDQVRAYAAAHGVELAPNAKVA